MSRCSRERILRVNHLGEEQVMLRRPRKPVAPVAPAVRQPEPPLSSQQTAQLTSVLSDLKSIQRAPRPVAVMIEKS